MSELYGAGTGGGEVGEPAAETKPAARAEHELAPDTPVSQYEDDAAIEARLDEAGLPTRAEARAAACEPDVGDEDDDFDVEDFGPESDAAIEARLDEAGLPTRAEARAAAREPDAAEDDDLDDTEKVDQQIDSAVDAVNPRYDRTESAYSENCTGVVQAYELRRRGHDVRAGPLEKNLRTDEGGPGGRSLDVIEKAWGGRFIPGSRAEIEEAFKQPGSRGVVYIRWDAGGAHVFNVENNGGKARFVDGQPTPARRDASRYFGRGHSTKYIRLDDRSEPPDSATGRYLER